MCWRREGGREGIAAVQVMQVVVYGFRKVMPVRACVGNEYF